MDDLLQLPLITNPVIERLILPEWGTSPLQNLVRSPSRIAFKRFRNPSQCHPRLNQQMNMIRHDHKCVQPIKPKLMLPEMKSTDNLSRNAIIA
jgi:hypothetical protein